MSRIYDALKKAEQDRVASQSIQTRSDSAPMPTFSAPGDFALPPQRTSSDVWPADWFRQNACH